MYFFSSRKKLAWNKQKRKWAVSMSGDWNKRETRKGNSKEYT